MAEVRDDYNRSGLLWFSFSMIFCVLFFVYLVLIHPGVDLKEIPEEAKTAGAANAVAAVDVTKIAEPWLENKDLIEHGKKVYSQNCAMCHGPEGKGDGAAAAAMNPKPRNLVEGPWKKGGGFIGLFEVVTKGLPGTSMAAFGHINLTDRWAVVQFINSITKAKVKEDPKKIAEFAKSAK